MVALAVLVIVTPHLLGGAPAWATLTISVLSTAALGLAAFFVRDRDDASPGVDRVTRVFCAALAITVLHAVPLPESLAAALGWDAHDHAVQAALGLRRDTPGWFAYTLDRPGTHERILYAVAVFAAFVAARLSATYARSRPVLVLVALSAIFIALSHLGHALFGATRVYGVYAPLYARPLGPLLNPNNLAGFMALAFPLCVGLGLREE